MTYLDEEKILYNEIRKEFENTNMAFNSLMFNYNLYTALYNILNEKDFRHNVISTIMYFIAKEGSIMNSLAVINNTYLILIMCDKDFIIRTLSGQKSNIILVDNDAAKLGALLALTTVLLDISKLDLLKETLFYTENML